MTSLISAEQLKAISNNDHLIILDASMLNPLPGVSNDIQQGVIPGARRLDLEQVFIDKHSALPHTMPDAEVFQREAQKLGIDADSEIVVYDNMGVYSAPRAWWMFKAMGHTNIRVLNGGLPAWMNVGDTEAQHSVAEQLGNFRACPVPELFISADEILNHLGDGKYTVLDARSLARFKGEEAEPRAGVRSGHIPGAKCLHFRSLTDNAQLKAKAQLTPLFNAVTLSQEDTLVMSCGSGITACILALAANEVGYANIRVFDGSWAEWGTDTRLPIELN